MPKLCFAEARKQFLICVATLAGNSLVTGNSQCGAASAAMCCWSPPARSCHRRWAPDRPFSVHHMLTSGLRPRPLPLLPTARRDRRSSTLRSESGSCSFLPLLFFCPADLDCSRLGAPGCCADHSARSEGRPRWRYCRGHAAWRRVHSRFTHALPPSLRAASSTAACALKRRPQQTACALGCSLHVTACTHVINSLQTFVGDAKRGL